jgi:hypothetical protein
MVQIKAWIAVNIGNGDEIRNEEVDHVKRGAAFHELIRGSLR